MLGASCSDETQTVQQKGDPSRGHATQSVRTLLLLLPFRTARESLAAIGKGHKDL